jgi:small-conductance mechanosensitive channel
MQNLKKMTTGLRYLWFILVVGVPLALTAFDLLGYVYTVLTLVYPIGQTLLIVATAVLLHSLMLRTLKLAEAKLSLDRIAEAGAEDPLSFIWREFIKLRNWGFEMRVFVREVEDRLNVIHQLHEAIYRTLAKNQITIPFPQRDVHVKYVDGARAGKNQRDNQGPD